MSYREADQREEVCSEGWHVWKVVDMFGLRRPKYSTARRIKMIIHCRKCKREFDNHSRRNQHEKDAHDYKAGSHPVNRGTIGNITDGKTVRIARAILAIAANTSKPNDKNGKP